MERAHSRLEWQRKTKNGPWVEMEEKVVHAPAHEARQSERIESSCLFLFRGFQFERAAKGKVALSRWLHTLLPHSRCKEEVVCVREVCAVASIHGNARQPIQNSLCISGKFSQLQIKRAVKGQPGLCTAC